MASSWGQSSTAYPSQASANPNQQQQQPGRGGSSQRGRGGAGGRGRGRGGKAPQSNRREDEGPSPIHAGLEGHLVCGHLEASAQADAEAEQKPCSWRTTDANALTLHRADRHLIMPPGGKEELDRIDPIAREERKEQERKARRQARLDGSDDDDEAETQVITGLNIALSTPELISMWVRERRKRWPSTAVVEQKKREAWHQNSNYNAQQRRSENEPASKRMRLEEPSTSTTQVKLATVNDHSESDDDDDDDSDDDGPPEVISSRPREAVSAHEAAETQTQQPEPAPAQATSETTMARPGAPICRYFQQGRCNYGSQCKSQHVLASHASSSNVHPSAAAAAQQPRSRPRPKAPPPNPFQAPHLLRALLANEIAQHVDAVAQTIRFLVRNEALRGVEMSVGEAEEQRRRRGLISVVTEEEGAGGEQREDAEELAAASDIKTESQLGAPLVPGALPTLPSSSTPGATTLYRPASPMLRALTELAYPPEPDPLIYLDPLRAADPKPLRREELVRLATDAQLRALLYPSSSSSSTTQGEHAQLSPSLKRAFETLDQLPSTSHRVSALELILGVSEQSPLHAHQAGASFVRPHPTGGARTRPIGEVELFRLGLRVGPEEVQIIRALAQRVSEVVGGVEFQAEAQGWEAREQAKDWREAKRRKEWEAEADKRDLLRSLGVDVD